MELKPPYAPRITKNVQDKFEIHWGGGSLLAHACLVHSYTGPRFSFRELPRAQKGATSLLPGDAPAAAALEGRFELVVFHWARKLLVKERRIQTIGGQQLCVSTGFRHTAVVDDVNRVRTHNRGKTV